MKSTFKVLFYLKKGSEKKNGEVMIMARITIDGKLCQFSTKQSIQPDNWSIAAGKAKGRDAGRINALLDDIRSSLNTIYHEMQRRDNYVTAEKVKNEFLGHSESHETILSLFQKHNDDVKQLVGISKTIATYRKYEVTRRHLAEFIQSKYNVSDISIKEISPMFITDFELYLRTACKCGYNTTAKFMQFFKRIIIIARNNGILVGDPFASYKIRLEKVDRGYLTEDEIKIILKKKMVSERLEHVRDLFVFSCFCGLAYSDVANLRQENIQKSFDGNLWIITKRQKTNTDVNVPLLDIPKMILKKYKGKLPDGKILPVISNQKLNAYLKEIADICGIKKNLTFHLARHTFATTTTLSKGVPIETVSKMLGHTNIETTQIYARITNSKIGSDMQGLDKKFVGIEIQPLMQVTNHSNNKSNMKEELLEAIYGTVERLEQKVDELSASPKNAGAETVLSPASVDTSKLEKAILSVSAKEEETIGKLAKLREAICVYIDLTKKEVSKEEQRSKLLFDTINTMKQEQNDTSKIVVDKLHLMGNTPQTKVVTHRFEPTSKNVLLFIVGLALSLVLSIWGNLTQWREHQDWEEADLKYRALKMVLPSDDPNVRYIEKNFSVCPNKEVIENVRTRVNIYEDSIRYHNEMIQMAAIKDSMANSLFKEANEIKKKINQK